MINRFFIAGINGEKAPKEVTIDLSFITGDFNSILIKDGKTPTTFAVDKNVDIGKSVTIPVLARGGFVMEFLKK